MKRSINILLGVLVVQFVLFALLTFRDESANNVKQTETLVALNFDKIDKVLIEDGTKKSVELVRKDGKWILPGLFNFPVAANKISETLKKISEEKRSWPLGNTMVAAKQFEVTDEKFERKLSFYEGDKLARTLYLGTSPGFKKVHARVDKEEKTYSLEFNAFDVPTTAQDWADHELNKLERSKISQVKFKDFSFTQSENAFNLDGLTTEEQTNKTEVEAMISKIINPTFDEVVAINNFETGPKVLEYSVANNDKSEHQYSFFEMKADAKAEAEQAAKAKAKGKPGFKETEDPTADKAKESTNEFLVMKASDQPYFFKLRRSRFEDLMKAQRASYVKKKGEEEKKTNQEAGQLNLPGPG